MNTPLITAVICTYNRKDYLRRAVESLLKQTLARNKFEIHIVDNGSVDGTPQVVSDLRQLDPEIRYTLEPTLGVSHARNQGWRQATAEYVAYLDDDELAAPDWLETILKVFSVTPKNTGCIGGKEVLRWESARPAWLPDQILYYLGQLDLSNELIEIKGPSWLGGGNSAYRREVLKAFGGFDTRLGRKGNSLLSMEDTLIQKRLVAAGIAVYYHPDIIIENAVPSARVTQEWFKKRAFWEGISEAFAAEYKSLLAYFRLPKTTARASAAILLKPKRLLALITPTNNPDRFLQKCIAWNRLGYIYGNCVRVLGKRR